MKLNGYYSYDGNVDTKLFTWGIVLHTRVNECRFASWVPVQQIWCQFNRSSSLPSSVARTGWFAQPPRSSCRVCCGGASVTPPDCRIGTGCSPEGKPPRK